LNMTVASQLKQTLANLKGAESTLLLYSLQSQEEDEKTVYKEAQEAANKVVKDLEDRIKFLEYEEPQYKGY